jgi:Na+/H+-dicarboxylate symporter
MNGQPMTSLTPSTMLYFSFVTLTATGMSDIMPVHPVARMLCTLEMITGILFIAVLIARLAGSYPPPER